MDDALTRLRPRLAGRLPGRVGEAVNYALEGSGKRVRGVLTLLAAESAGAPGDVSGVAAAVEVVHAYSLVHDDLPCMDDDDLRRGRPTVHRRFDVPAATAAGVAMVPLAVIAALTGAADAGLPRDAGGAIVFELMSHAGADGMIGGQALDLESEGRALGVDELDRLHSAKTGALFVAAARVGAIAARADRSRIDALGQFGAHAGLAFQIVDDVLDVTATAESLGKTTGRDAAMNKSTYPAAVGIAEATLRARKLVSDAESALHRAGLASERLSEFARQLTERAA